MPISQLGEDYFIYDEISHTVTGERTREQFQMGQQVEVKLVEAAPVAGALRFEMVSEGTKSSSVPRSRPGNRSRANARGPGNKRNRRKR